MRTRRVSQSCAPGLRANLVTYSAVMGAFVAWQHDGLGEPRFRDIGSSRKGILLLLHTVTITVMIVVDLTCILLRGDCCGVYKKHIQALRSLQEAQHKSHMNAQISACIS